MSSLGAMGYVHPERTEEAEAEAQAQAEEEAKADDKRVLAIVVFIFTVTSGTLFLLLKAAVEEDDRTLEVLVKSSLYEHCINLNVLALSLAMCVFLIEATQMTMVKGHKKTMARRVRDWGMWLATLLMHLGFTMTMIMIKNI